VSFLFGLEVTLSGSFHYVTEVIMDNSLVHSCVWFGVISAGLAWDTSDPDERTSIDLHCGGPRETRGVQIPLPAPNLAQGGGVLMVMDTDGKGDILEAKERAQSGYRIGLAR